METTVNTNIDKANAGLDYDQLMLTLNAEAAEKRNDEKSRRTTNTVVPERIPGFTMWDTANITAARMLLGVDPDQKIHIREINRVKIAYRDTVSRGKINALRGNPTKWSQFLTYLQSADGNHKKEQIDVIFGPHEKDAKDYLMNLLLQHNLFDEASTERKAATTHMFMLPEVAPKAIVAPKPVVAQPKIGKITFKEPSATAFHAPKPLTSKSVSRPAAKPIQLKDEFPAKKIVLPAANVAPKPITELLKGPSAPLPVKKISEPVIQIAEPVIEQVIVPVEPVITAPVKAAISPVQQVNAPMRQEMVVYKKPRRPSLFEVSSLVFRRYTSLPVGSVY